VGWVREGEIAGDPRLEPQAAEAMIALAQQVEACRNAFPGVFELILDMTLRRAPVDHRLQGEAYLRYAQERHGQNQVAASLLTYLELAERIRNERRGPSPGDFWGHTDSRSGERGGGDGLPADFSVS
jgi:hypothetical protein